MAWTRVDDNFLGHPKTVRAAQILGKFGLGRVLVVWHQGQSHANRYLTNGYLTRDVVARFHDDPRPLAVADAMVSSGLWEAAGDDYAIHDYLDYNSSKDAVLQKRARDLGRKKTSVGDELHPLPIPPTFHGDSTRKTRGIEDATGGEATAIPLTFHGDSNATRAGGRGRPVPRSHVRHVYDTNTERKEEDPGAGAPPSSDPPVTEDDLPSEPFSQNQAPVLPIPPRIATGPHRNHASCGRPCVPSWTHEELRRHLGGDEEQADQAIRAWYRATMTAWAGQPIGDKPEAFWWARFREWQGTTATIVKPTRTSGNQRAATEALQLLRTRA